MAFEGPLEVVLVDRADELLQLPMRGQDDRRGRRLIQIADLEPDDPVLDVIDDPDAVAGPDLGGTLEQLDQPEPLAVQRDRAALLEPDETVSASSGASSGRVTSWKTSSGAGSFRSSIVRPSEERPQRLSSIEYGETSVPPFTGIPCSRA